MRPLTVCCLLRLQPQHPPCVSLDGMRYVLPYSSPLIFNVKKRWWGAPLLRMLQTEYKNPLADHYPNLLAAGRIDVTQSGQQQPLALTGVALGERLLKPNDRVCVRLHRHEPPVPDVPIEIIHRGSWRPDGDSPAAADGTAASASVAPASSAAAAAIPESAIASETLVVNKPAGMPVHASGRYQWNTVVGRLWSEHGIEAFRQ